MSNRLFGNRILITLFVAMILGFSLPVGTFGAQLPETKQEESREVSGIPQDSGVSSGTVYTRLQPTTIPQADDRSSESRDYICAASGERSGRSVSVRKLGFLIVPGTYALTLSRKEEGSLHVGGLFFDDLTIIHYIHSQDGSKG